MDSKKDDRRVKYSKMVIRSSFITLLSQKPISKITVKEICERADVNRATFYAHYTDQYDLLARIQAELLGDIRAYLSGLPQTVGLTGVTGELLTNILEYIRRNADICSVLLSSSGDFTFQKQVLMLVQDDFIAEWTTLRSVTKQTAEYAYTFVLAGSVGLIQKWLKDGMTMPSARLARLLLELTNRGLTALSEN